MIKQVVFWKKRPGMTTEEFMDYHENQHSQLSENGPGNQLPRCVPTFEN